MAIPGDGSRQVVARPAGVVLTRRRWCRAGAALASLWLSGCAVSKPARGTPGIDLGSIRPGARRADVEAVVGSPARRWTTAAGVEYCIYNVDRGIPPNMADAAAIAFLDIATLGLWEVLEAFDPSEPKPGSPRRTKKVAVSYDVAGIVLGVFMDVGDFDELPVDGRVPAGR